MIKPMIDDMIRPMITGMVNQGCREVIIFDQAAKYITYPAFTPTGDFEIEIEIQTSDATSQMTVFGGDSSTDYVRLDVFNGSARLVAEVGGITQPIISVAGVADGKLHTLNATYTGTTAALSVDGGSPASNTWSLDGGQQVDVIGATTPTPRDFFDGNIRNAKIWEGGNKTTGTLVRSSPLDDGFKNNPNIKETVSGQNGTAVNLTRSDWVQDCN